MHTEPYKNMKTKMKRQGSTELPRFTVGALAIAGASAANAATVQITFNGSYISSTGGNHLVTDFGGDGTGDNLRGYTEAAGVRLYWGGGYQVGGAFNNGIPIVFVEQSSAMGSFSGGGVVTLRGITRVVSFTDANVRDGASTLGYLDITSTVAGTDKRVTVNRLIFDDVTGGEISGLNVTAAAFTEYGSSPVPEPGSNLALLALGAGGLTLRRRLKRAA